MFGEKMRGLNWATAVQNRQYLPDRIAATLRGRPQALSVSMTRASELSLFCVRQHFQITNGELRRLCSSAK